MKNSVKLFFAQSDLLDYMVLRQLSHVNLSWELIWEPFQQEYEREDGTVAGLFIDLIDDIQAVSGCIKAPINHGQRHFDDIEQSHQKILADVLTIILYHRMGNIEI